MYKNIFKKAFNNAKAEIGEKISEVIDVSLKQNLEKAIDKRLSPSNVNTINNEKDNDNNIEMLPPKYADKKCQNDDKFIDNISSRIYEIGTESIKSPDQALSIINSLVNVVKDVEKFREVQETKRVIIDSNKELLVAKINAQKEIIMMHLEKTFDERKDAFSNYFSVVDDALKKNNIEQLAMGLDKVSELAKSSPFKELADINKVGLALQNKDYEWDF